MKQRIKQRRTAMNALTAIGMVMGLGLLGLTSGAATTAAAATQPHLVAMPHATSVPEAASIPARGEFDCNGDSPVEAPARAELCTDIRGLPGVNNANEWGSRFYDNGTYIGHDEPDMTFLSSRKGAGNNVTWNETLPVDPSAAPTVTDPGHDVSHWYELSPAPWYSMMMCDPYSYPQLPCTPESDGNAPSCTAAFNCPTNSYPGAGSAVMELQFYPPGNAPFVDDTSCSGTDWCAALTIDSLECTDLYATCQPNCEEPVNFSFLQTDGVPTGPAGPGDSDLATSVPNADTLLMKPGDKISVHMFDAPAPAVSGALGGSDAFEAKVVDETQHTSGYIQASAANGFEYVDMLCQVGLANFQPEYNTAAKANINPWAALQTDVSTEYETGHFEPCSSLTGEITNPFDPNDTGGTYTTCAGAYEGSSPTEGAEASDAICYPANDPHTGYDGPGTTAVGAPIANCQDNYYQNGDLDFDGTPYRAEWPTGPKATSLNPSSFVESLPTTMGKQYSKWYFQTDVALSESTCKMSSSGTVTGCSVPPKGTEVDTPSHTAFYPYWTEVDSHGTCTIEFGNVRSGTGVNDFGRDAQYGKDQYHTWGYPEYVGPVKDNTCKKR